MSLQVIDLEEKHPSEIVEYQFDLSKISAFGSNADTLDQNATWYVYDVDDTTTNLASTMVYAYDYSAANDIIKCTVQAGTSGKYYYLVGAATIAATGRKYVVIGKFYVRSLGITL